MSADRVQVQVGSPDTRRRQQQQPQLLAYWPLPLVVIVIGNVVVADALVGWVKFKASHFATFMRFSRWPAKI